MTPQLHPYPSYKASGLSWLDEIPAHWETKRNGQLFVQRNETGFADLPILEVSLRTGVRVRQFDGSGRKQMMSDRSKYKRAVKGDLAYNMMRMWQGAVGVAPEDGLISPAYVAARPRDSTNAPYYSELFRTSAYMGEVDANSHGIVKDRNRLYWEDFKQIYSICPPFDEQLAIVRFISRYDQLTRRYIHAKRQMMAVLREQRQLIIDEALRPPSNASADWQPNRLKYVATVQTGITLGKDYGRQQLDEYPYLRVANVQAGTLDLTDVATIQVPDAEARGAMLRYGDVLMTEGGDIDKLGRGTVWRAEVEPCLHQNHIFAVRPKKEALLPDYLAYLLASTHGRRYFELTAKKTTNLASTNSTTLGRFPVLLPDVEQQRRLVDLITAQTAELDRATIYIEREIELLREYRATLTAAAVMGKLDVREAAAQIPEEPAEVDGLSLPDGIPEEGDEADADLDELVGESVE